MGSLAYLSILLLAVSAMHSRTVASLGRMAPAFVWSNSRSCDPQTQGNVDYRIFSPQSLMETLLQKFGWSQLLDSNYLEEQKVDVLLAFIGGQMRSVDLSRTAGADLDVIHQLKESFTMSNYSVAFPYVALQEEELIFAKSLIAIVKSNFKSHSSHRELVVAGSCLTQLDTKSSNGHPKFLDTVEDIKDYLEKRKETKGKSEADVLLVCMTYPAESQRGKQSLTEGEVLMRVLSALQDSGTSHSALYLPDSSVPSHQHTSKGRLLASNSTSNTTCNGICQTKATLLEALIVGIVLLIILISGLCCMMGVDSPTRFEMLQES